MYRKEIFEIEKKKNLTIQSGGYELRINYSCYGKT